MTKLWADITRSFFSYIFSKCELVFRVNLNGGIYEKNQMGNQA